MSMIASHVAGTTAGMATLGTVSVTSASLAPGQIWIAQAARPEAVPLRATKVRTRTAPRANRTVR